MDFSSESKNLVSLKFLLQFRRADRIKPRFSRNLSKNTRNLDLPRLIRTCVKETQTNSKVLVFSAWTKQWSVLDKKKEEGNNFAISDLKKAAGNYKKVYRWHEFMILLKAPRIPTYKKTYQYCKKKRKEKKIKRTKHRRCATLKNLSNIISRPRSCLQRHILMEPGILTGTTKDAN